METLYQEFKFNESRIDQFRILRPSYALMITPWSKLPIIHFSGIVLNLGFQNLSYKLSFGPKFYSLKLDLERFLQWYNMLKMSLQ